jgi:hypothetical protein
MLLLAEEKVPGRFDHISAVANGGSEQLTEDGDQNKNSCPKTFTKT